jgi:hypothetical protein
MPIRAILAILLFSTGIAQAQPAGPAPVLVGHKAGYVLTLERLKGNDLQGVSGTMGYEIVDACDGWAVRQRLSLVMTSADGQDVTMVSDYATFESKDGTRLRFRMRQTTEDAITSQTEGVASLRRMGGPGEVRYAQPTQKRLDLPAGTQFPMIHTLSVLNAAREGRKFLSIPLFDGTGDNGTEDSSAVVLDWRQGVTTDHAPLAKLFSTRVRLAFFDRKSSEQTPSYEVSMRYWENGVSDELLMDFGDFSLRGKMREFAILPRRC